MITIYNPTPKDVTQLDELTSFLEEEIKERPVFKELFSEDKHEEVVKCAEEFGERFSHIVWFGTGGSSLGGMSVCELDPSPKKKISFCDNIDPRTIHDILAYCTLKNSGFIFASKSGNTSETVMQLMAVIQLLEKRGLKPAHHIILISQKGDHVFSKFAKYYNLETLGHPSNIGGRFSVFSITGMFPALLSQVDGNLIRRAAASFLKDQSKLEQAAQFALWYNEQYQNGLSNYVVLPYCDRMRLFSQWLCQLWGESLGKRDAQGQRFGSLPVGRIGTVFQHSQLQLYLDGPKKEVMSVISVSEHEHDDVIESPLRSHFISDLSGHTLGQLMKAHSQATLETFKKHAIPARHIICQRYDEETLGQLLANSMLEVLAVAKLWNVDPFDQPAVEEGKILAMENLLKS